MTLVQTQCCQFFKILIKKSGCFFYKGLFVFFATRVGAFLFTIGKKLKIEKVKTKKWLCTIQNI